MKNFPSIVLAAGLLSAASLTAIAQTQKGQAITSGSINLSLNGQRGGFSSQSTSELTGYTAGFSVNRGVFFKDNWLLGYSVGFSYGRTVFSASSGSMAVY